MLQLTFLLFLGLLIEQEEVPQSSLPPDYYFSRAMSLHDSDPDSAFQLYKLAEASFDSLSNPKGVIKCQIALADLYKNKGYYHSAFDALWDMQLLAEDINDTIALIGIHKQLGSLYSIYGKYEDALYHFAFALTLVRSNQEVNQSALKELNQIYYSLALTKRKSGDYVTALNYLDSCLFVRGSLGMGSSSTSFIDTEKGVIYLKMDELDQAKKYLTKAHRYFVGKNQGYRIFTSLYLGDLSAKKERWQDANQRYRYALEAQETTNMHSDMKVEILKKLSQSYTMINETGKAYKYLEEAISITDSLFNTKSSINSQLFSIRDKYDEQMRTKDDFIGKQEAIIEKKEIVESRLRIFIGFMLLVLLAFLVFLIMRKKLRKAKMLQDQIRMQADHDLEKSRVISDVKSRELTASTLQMIEKDRMVDELLEELKKEAPASYTSMKSKMHKGSADMWERFNKRFIEVDTQFYDRLRTKHPDLTPTEQRHCALVKLNFDSKEMASLLGISINSVHISRHRIRKKMGLERDDNLTVHISNI
ncbi:MAG: hypothetical protein AAF616_00500 [Bacteroidota bacterium]